MRGNVSLWQGQMLSGISSLSLKIMYAFIKLYRFSLRKKQSSKKLCLIPTIFSILPPLPRQHLSAICRSVYWIGNFKDLREEWVAVDWKKTQKCSESVPV